jgi:hypothetical protein
MPILARTTAKPVATPDPTLAQKLEKANLKAQWERRLKRVMKPEPEPEREKVLKAPKKNWRRQRYDTADPRGGSHYRRGAGGGRGRLASGVDCRDPNGVKSCGYRFPDTGATESQRQTFLKIVTEYFRRETVRRYAELGAEAVAGIMGLKERQAQTLLNEVAAQKGDPVIELAKTVFHSMHTRKIAGVLGTRHSKTSRAVFRLINTIDADRVPGDHDLFYKWMAAFRIDYEAWEREGD